MIHLAGAAVASAMTWLLNCLSLASQTSTLALTIVLFNLYIVSIQHSGLTHLTASRSESWLINGLPDLCGRPA